MSIGYQIIEGPPKSAASRRTIALDRRTATVLRRQRAAYLIAGRPWLEIGYVFTRTDGKPYHPNYLTHRLRYLIGATGLPPARLHDIPTPRRQPRPRRWPRP